MRPGPHVCCCAAGTSRSGPGRDASEVAATHGKENGQRFYRRGGGGEEERRVSARRGARGRRGGVRSRWVQRPSRQPPPIKGGNTLHFRSPGMRGRTDSGRRGAAGVASAARDSAPSGRGAPSDTHPPALACARSSPARRLLLDPRPAGRREPGA